jgi:phage FluMu protein Com
MKIIFKDNLGNIHFGLNAPRGFREGVREDVISALKNLGGRKIWRCAVCNDLRIAADPLEQCPTCHAVDAYVQIEEKEFNQLIEIL